MAVLAKFIDCGTTAHSAEDDRSLLTYLTSAGILCGRRNDCARTTPAGMQVAIDAGEVSVPFQKTGGQQIWAHIIITNQQTITFDPGGAAPRYDALVLEIINDGQCPADATQAQSGQGMARFKAVRGSASSPLSENDIETALGHDNWIRFDNIDVPASATEFGVGGSDASVEQVIGCSTLTLDPAQSIFDELASNANGKGASMIGIEDSGGNFVSESVEDALEELKIAQPIPVGTMFDYAGAAAPSGFLFCDGSAVDRSTYGDLYTVVGDQFRGDAQLTTRTDNDTGVITMVGGNRGITDSETLDLHWNGGSRTGMTITNVAGANITVDGGSGDNLPALNDAVQVVVATSKFLLPDYRGRVGIGKDNMGGTSANRVTSPEADTVGLFKGEEEHTLTEGELPAHSHDVGSSVNNSQNGSGNYFAGSTNSAVSGQTGGDEPHNNMQPYVTVTKIIKT